MKHRFKRAFTITELVIVIAVIAILAAVLIPTFASVIDESKKSHDTQYMKEINVAIADYTAMKGHAPQDYEELMLALADEGLCDANNPFLLATALKQENMLLVWFPGTDKVRLVDTSTESMLFDRSRGNGNMVQLYTAGENIESNYAFILCNTGHPDSMVAAEVYRRFYLLSGGSINSFLQGGTSIEDLVKDMENKSWANSIIDSMKNAQQGYTYDQGIAQDILDDFKGNTSAQVDLTKNLTAEDKAVLENGEDFSKLSPNGQAAVEQSVRGTLATLASLENDSATKDNLSGKKVKFNAPAGTVVDMQDVTLTPIGQTSRKEKLIDKGAPKSTVSVDYSGITLENMNIPEDKFISTGAENQSESDSGHPGGGYAFTYGLFGTVIAEPGQTITIENLKLKNVYMNFKGATENINGQTVNTFADNAGIIIGYAQGNVELRNIEIDGADETGRKGLISGYDAIAGVVGRAYGAKVNGKTTSSKLLLDNITIKNMDIEGERRASGFVGFISNNMNDVTIQNSRLENVMISCKRNDGDTAKQVYQCWAMTFIMGDGNNVRIENNTLKDVTTAVNFFGNFLDGIDNNKENGAEGDWGAIATSKYAYANSPLSTVSNLQGNQYLLLVCSGSAYLNNNTYIATGNSDSETKTYKLPNSTSESEKTGAGKYDLTAVVG